MPALTTRLGDGRYEYLTPVGAFIIQRGPRRYQRAKDGNPGTHGTDWTVAKAPEKYEAIAAPLSERTKNDLLDRINEIAATSGKFQLTRDELRIMEERARDENRMLITQLLATNQHLIEINRHLITENSKLRSK